MTRDDVNAACAQFPGVTCEDPWGDGHDAWKVGGKMFACNGPTNDGVSVKTESVEQAMFLIELERGEKAPYFHRSWIRLPFDSDIDPDELRDRLATSYDLIRKKLTKKVQATLPPWP